MIGLLVDGRNEKRYSYPADIFVDLNAPKQYYTRPTISVPQKNIFSISPLIVFDPVNPAFDMSYERKVTNRFSAQLRFGQLISRSLTNYYRFENIRGNRWGLEVRNYLKNNAPKGTYLAVEYNRLKSKALTHSNFFSRIFDDNYPGDFTLDKRTHNFNLKLGYQYVYNGFVCDTYFGMGIKDRHAKYVNGPDANDQLVTSKDFNVNNRTLRAGHEIGFNLIANVRIGYAF